MSIDKLINKLLLSFNPYFLLCCMPSNFMYAFIFQLKNKYGDAFLRGNNGMYSCKDVVPHTHQSSNMFKSGLINPLHPDINLHILYTVLCSFRYIS